MDDPVVSILVVSYNTREMTLACLRSVFDQTTRTPFEVIVVDNESSDDSADAVDAEFGARVRLIRAQANLGFARANNLAAESARGQYLLLLNPDTVVLDHAIDALVEFARRTPDARIWGGRTVFADGRLNPTSCWARQTPWNLTCRVLGLAALFPRSSRFNSEALGGWPRDRERGVDIVTGCFLLIARKDWDTLRGFDEAFFMYGEEADLCLRARRVLNARPRFTPSATVVHYGGASERVRADKLVRLLSAKRLLIRRHWHPIIAWYGMTMIDLWAWSRTIAATARRSNGNGWTDVWRRRREWQFTSRREPAPGGRAP